MYTDSNGDIYCGNWIINKKIKEGNGAFLWSNGDFYEGQFKNDEPDGYGRIIYSTGNVYEGLIKENMMDLYGKITFRNGESYVG